MFAPALFARKKKKNNHTFTHKHTPRQLIGSNEATWVHYHQKMQLSPRFKGAALGSEHDLSFVTLGKARI